MQFPRYGVAPRFHIVGIATFADTVESSPNRIACETAPRMCACTHAGPMARAWDQHLARGPDTWRVDPVVCAWAAPPRRISRGWRTCYGLTRMFSGSRASGTPGQVSLGPSRRPPCPGHPIVSVCYRSGLHCGRHTTPRHDLTALNRGLTGSKRGNCASRGPMRDLLADDYAIKWGELHH